MKKQNRIIKINDNFSNVELYYEPESMSGIKTISILVIVDSRTFSGRYNINSSNKSFIIFKEQIKKCLENVQKGNISEKLYFQSDYQNLQIEIKAMSTTKISWTLTFKPFLPEIEILTIVLETELNLLNSFKNNIEKLIK